MTTARRQDCPSEKGLENILIGSFSSLTCLWSFESTQCVTWIQLQSWMSLLIPSSRVLFPFSCRTSLVLTPFCITMILLILLFALVIITLDRSLEFRGQIRGLWGCFFLPYLDWTQFRIPLVHNFRISLDSNKCLFSAESQWINGSAWEQTSGYMQERLHDTKQFFLCQPSSGSYLCSLKKMLFLCCCLVFVGCFSYIPRHFKQFSKHWTTSFLQDSKNHMAAESNLQMVTKSLIIYYFYRLLDAFSPGLNLLDFCITYYIILDSY